MAVYERQDPYRNQMTKGLISGLSGALEGLTQSKLKEIERQRIAQGLKGIGFEEEEAKGLSNLPLDIQKEVVKEQFSTAKEARKANQKVVHDIVSAEKGARDNLNALRRIEELDRRGNVQGLSGELLKKVGLGRFRSADTHELEKLSVGMLSNLKNIFGARPTNLDVKLYMESIPSLLQSPEGRQRIIRNLKAANQAAGLRADTLREILKENNNRVPENLELEIENRIGPQLDRLNSEISASPTGNEGQGSDELPNPAQYAGKKIRDTQTGQILQSDGRQWLPIGG